jgi:hypothetical protein
MSTSIFLHWIPESGWIACEHKYKKRAWYSRTYIWNQYGVHTFSSRIDIFSEVSSKIVLTYNAHFGHPTRDKPSIIVHAQYEKVWN